MIWKIGTLVQVISTGYKGVITSIRIGASASDGLHGCMHGFCPYNPKAKLPNYIEIDGWIQIHPSRVRRIQ